ncbi:MAG: hypothetical protein K6T75_08340 [Acetobacteraceae bacterium]|nr:hypothetical protein [Acetobacteraceae bacterium]
MVVTDRLLWVGLQQDRVLAVNTLSGSVDVFGPQVWKALRGCDGVEPGTLSADQLRLLERRGYLFSDAAGEEAAWEAMVRAAEQEEGREAFAVGVETSALGLDCPARSGAAFRPPGPWGLGPEKLPRLFRALRELRRLAAGRPVLWELMGGEPLQPAAAAPLDLIFAEAQRQPGVGLRLWTGGAALLEFRPVLLQHRSVLRSLGVVLEPLPPQGWPGGGPSQERLRRVAEGMDWALEHGLAVDVGIGFRLHEEGRLEGVFALFEARGWPASGRFRCLLSPVVAYPGPLADPPDEGRPAADRGLSAERPPAARGWSGPEAVAALCRLFPGGLPPYLELGRLRAMASLRSLLSGLPGGWPAVSFCPAVGGRSLWLAADGLVYPCPLRRGALEGVVGTWLTAFSCFRPLPGAEGEGPRSVLRLDVCRRCPAATLCGGGCAAEAAAGSGRPACPESLQVAAVYLSLAARQYDAAREGAVAGPSRLFLSVVGPDGAGRDSLDRAAG